MAKHERMMKDLKFRKWMQKRNIDDKIVFALGTNTFIKSLRKQYLKEKRSKK